MLVFLNYIDLPISIIQKVNEIDLGQSRPFFKITFHWAPSWTFNRSENNLNYACSLSCLLCNNIQTPLGQWGRYQCCYSWYRLWVWSVEKQWYNDIFFYIREKLFVNPDQCGAISLAARLVQGMEVLGVETVKASTKKHMRRKTGCRDWLIDWLFTVLHPLQEYFTNMKTSPLPVKGCKI
jgi:hypothetical protein